MLSFNSINGQSLYDICLNTYGSLDFMSKLLKDNGIENIEIPVPTSKEWNWDETLTMDQAVNQKATNASIYYATSAMTTGSTLAIVVNDINKVIPIGGNEIVNRNPNNTYQQISEVQFVAIGGEFDVDFSEIAGCDIIQITRNIQPLLTSEYVFTKATGNISLSGDVMEVGEVLFIIYSKKISI